MAKAKTYGFFLFLLPFFAISQDPIAHAKKLFETKEFEKAIPMLSAIKPEDAGYDQSLYYLGRIAVEKKEYDQSIEHFEAAIEADPKIAEYHNWLGVMYGVVAMNSNTLRQAFLAPKIKNEFEAAVALEPNNLQTRWGLLNYYVKAPGFLGGSWPKALETANFISQRSKTQGLRAFAFIHEARKEYDLAENKLRAALNEDPTDGASHCALALIYERLGNKLKARAYYQTSLELEPGMKEALEGLSRVNP